MLWRTCAFSRGTILGFLLHAASSRNITPHGGTNQRTGASTAAPACSAVMMPPLFSAESNGPTEVSMKCEDRMPAANTSPRVCTTSSSGRVASPRIWNMRHRPNANPAGATIKQRCFRSGLAGLRCARFLIDWLDTAKSLTDDRSTILTRAAERGVDDQEFIESNSIFSNPKPC
jgi:hypothetical protein